MSDSETKEHPETQEKPTESPTHAPAEDFPDPAAEPIPGLIPEEINQFNLSPPKLKDLIRSSDSPSRYLTWLSITFGVLALLCYGLLLNRYLDYRKRNRNLEAERQEAEQLYGGWLSKQNYFNKRKLVGDDAIYTQSIGEYRVTWDGAELRADLVAECSDEETCAGLKEKPVQLHDLILPILQASSPDEVLNPNKKLELRRAMVDKINELKFKGKVLQIDFSDLTVEPAPHVPLSEPEPSESNNKSK